MLAAGGWALFVTLHDPDVPLEAPRVVARARAGPEVVVILAGDFAPADHAMPFIRRHGYPYPFAATAPILRGADVAFANLEAPVTAYDEPFWPYKDWLYRVEPEAMEAIAWSGLDLVSLANNHLIDYRERGLLDTLAHLDASPVERVGAGATEAEARRPVVFDVGGTRVGFLAYLEHKAAFNLYLRTFAVGDRPGCARLGLADVEEDVRRLRPLVDVLIVSVHWGLNYAGVTPTQQEYARRFAALGVDVVAGHHPHDVQRIERIGETLVLYSVGNYAWGARGWGDLRVGLLVRLRITPRRGETPGRIAAVEAIPIAVQNRMVDYQPRPLRLDEIGWLEPLLADSRAHGTELALDGTLLRVR